MSFTGLLIHTIYKSTATSSQNDFGEWTHAYTSQTSSPITCRVSPIYGGSLSNKEEIIITGKYDDVKYRCFMDDSESIYTGDRIIYDSKEYRVKEMIVDSTGHHKSALLTEL